MSFVQEMQEAMWAENKPAYLVYLPETDEWSYTFSFDAVEEYHENHPGVLWSFIRLGDIGDIPDIIRMIKDR